MKEIPTTELISLALELLKSATKSTTEIKPYGIVKKREALEFNGKKCWLVLDYIVWNEITLEEIESGKKASMWQGMSDEEAEEQFSHILSKLNGK